MNNKVLQSLLFTVSNANRHFKNFSKLKGENFNIFKILGVETREVRLHSALISELLNPNGDHALGNVFAIELGNVLAKKQPPEKNTDKQKRAFNFENIKNSQTEFYSGPKTDTDGGRIDILLNDSSGQKLIIENKIYANEQEKQLERYHNQFPDATIIFLTLDGKEPSEDIAAFKDQVICVSYKNEIIEWLQKSKKHAVDQPLLRETIEQYINLIKKLTNQSTNQLMNMEVVKIISSNLESYEAAKLIRDNFQEADNDFKNSLDKAISDIQKFEDLWLSNNHIIHWRKIKFTFIVCYDNGGDTTKNELFIGIHATTDIPNIDPTKVSATQNDLTDESIKKLEKKLNSDKSKMHGIFKEIILRFENFYPIIVTSHFGEKFEDFDKNLKEKLFTEQGRKEWAKEVVKEGIEFWNDFRKLLVDVDDQEKNTQKQI